MPTVRPTAIAAFRALAPGTAGTLSRPFLRFLADQLLPALLFAGAAGARAADTLVAAARLPAEAGHPDRLGHLLGVAGGVLAVLFCALAAVLLLERRAPQGRRAGPGAVLAALAGTLLMNGVLVQPVSTPEPWVVALADGLLAAGLAFSIYGAASLGRCFGLAAEARGLVTTGAYRFVRHPLYLGELVAALGVVLAALAPWTALLFAAFCACQAARAALEERALAAAFPEYAAYRRLTPALLPWPRPAAGRSCDAAGSVTGRRRRRTAHPRA